MNPLTAYVKTLWRNDDSPDLDADHLNNLEDGLERATDGVNGVLDEALGAKSDAAGALQLLNQHLADYNNPHKVTAAQVGASSGGSTGGGGGGLGIDIVARGARGDDATDNTAIIQACLDEIRTAGGGTLVIPRRLNNTIYRTRCLWVPSQCRILSDGATLKNIGWSSDTRYASWDGDQIAADGVLSIQPQTKYGFSSVPNNVYVTDLRLDVSSARLDGVLTYGIDVGGSGVFIEKVAIEGDPKDCINFGERRGQAIENIHIDRCYLAGARRNIISIEGADIRRVWIRDSLLRSCSGVPTPVGAGQMDASPGCGIDIEQPSAGGSLAHIYILNNWITNNAGPAIGFNWNVQPSDTLEGILIEGNRLSDNSANPQGGLNGGIFLKGGRTDEDLRILGNRIDGTRSGAGIQGQTDPSGYWRHKTLIANNIIAGNAGGGISIPGGVAAVTQSANLVY